MGSNLYEDNIKLARDTAGVVYFSSIFRDSIKLGGTVYRIGNARNIYFTKIGANGQPMWTKFIPTRGAFSGPNISFNSRNEIYLFGDCRDSVALGSTHLIADPDRYLSMSTSFNYLAKLSVLPNAITNIPASQDKIILYPNPTTGKITVRFSNNQVTAVSITDELGKVVYRQHIKDATLSLDLSFLPDGIYFAQFADSKASTTRKLIIRH